MIDVPALLRVTYCYITDITAHIRSFNFGGLRRIRVRVFVKVIVEVIVKVRARARVKVIVKVIVEVIVRVRAWPATAFSRALKRAFKAASSRGNLQGLTTKTIGSFPSINPMVLRYVDKFVPGSISLPGSLFLPIY
jgi:hypothetical protein